MLLVLSTSARVRERRQHPHRPSFQPPRRPRLLPALRETHPPHNLPPVTDPVAAQKPSSLIKLVTYRRPGRPGRTTASRPALSGLSYVRACVPGPVVLQPLPPVPSITFPGSALSYPGPPIGEVVKAPSLPSLVGTPNRHRQILPSIGTVWSLDAAARGASLPPSPSPFRPRRPWRRLCPIASWPNETLPAFADIRPRRRNPRARTLYSVRRHYAFSSRVFPLARHLTRPAWVRGVGGYHPAAPSRIRTCLGTAFRQRNGVIATSSLSPRIAA